ncbi:hypothetical protein JTE90_023811 [Oedothorax gibbosus]|uniref:LON peptidase N-terminal domain and RING finger protein 3 n=1 Tax=Oedothorax gibbosus TaxID=931172 RepID=A0AAV6VIF5_9ARAC|nr:hypothetical protein JTE90_023811 [Oedothorax gibbosus]
MGESDLQANYNNKGEDDNFDGEVSETAQNIDLMTGPVHSLLKCGNVHEALNVYIDAYSSDCPNSAQLELHLHMFVDGVVENARENVANSATLNMDYFLCMCGEMMTDPVTLKCGHTISKKCALSTMKTDGFECKKCGKRHSRAYISQLKNNVIISALIDKLWKMQKSEKSSDLRYHLPTYSQKKTIKSPTPSSMTFLREGDSLVRKKMYEEAIKMYLICLTFDPNARQAKEKAVKLLHNFLLEHQRKFQCRKTPQYAITINLKKAISKKRRSKDSSNGNIRNDESKGCKLTGLMDDELSNAEEEAREENRLYANDSAEANRLHKILDNFCNYIEDFSDEKVVKDRIDVSSLDKQDFECSLCMRILWEPVSTPCGHTFCRVCLNRCFDHRPTCPLCKASLANYLAERIQSTTEFLELTIKTLLPKEYAARKEMHKEEMDEFSNTGKDSEHVIPLFVCTTAFPTVPCPLHVFEPRYRLMIRQCMESGSRQFGMCTVVDNNIAEYGTMLEIRDVQYFPDGRSVVDTVGSRRFRILRKGEHDGYTTGVVEFLEDEGLIEEDLQDVKELHDQVYKFSEAWFMRLPRDTKNQILQHFGSMPEVEVNYYSCINGPSWFWWMLAILPIEPRSQLMFLSMTSLPHRLKTLYRVLLHLQSTIVT